MRSNSSVGDAVALYGLLPVGLAVPRTKRRGRDFRGLPGRRRWRQCHRCGGRLPRAVMHLCGAFTEGVSCL